MGLATVTPQFVNPPKGAGKDGSIKLSDGSMYSVPPALLTQFAPGATYEIQYSERAGTGQWAGRIFRKVVTAQQINAAPAVQTGSNSYRQTDDVTAERIFVCGGLNSALQAGQVNIGDTAGLFNAVQNMRETWARTFGNKGGTAGARQSTQNVPRDDMNDSIPF